ncbi:neo-calmodulin-like [Mytilus trossulus]|uniref:neo-calmodulin-like n=1 Tax=Mytilus trossulus TaxID=6551 RepID=UPI0030047057
MSSMKRQLSEVSKQAISETFALFDSDRDGKVSKKEIGAMMRSLGYLTCSEELDDILHRLDSDGNGYIDYQEFEDFAIKINMVKKDTLEDPDFRAAFDMLDRNKDGFIDQSELKYFMKQFGDKNAEDDSLETIIDADKDGDGKINYNEYAQHMKGKI